MKATLMNVQSGKVDLLIGTHRLFNKDVHFKDLGLLVVDEEQRFGVQHKEKLKELSKQVDVLTLSATPIPRTLNMALSGIRDMSTPVSYTHLDVYKRQSPSSSTDRLQLNTATGAERQLRPRCASEESRPL